MVGPGTDSEGRAKTKAPNDPQQSPARREDQLDAPPLGLKLSAVKRER